jgi:iron complex transport system ATP-binding protein
VAWNVTVETLVRLGRLPHRTATRRAAQAAMAALDLGDLAARAGDALGGESARALLARVLAGQPRWVLADEPFAALDLAHQQALMAHFRRLAEAGRGVAVVMHDLSLAMNHADRVSCWRRGRWRPMARRVRHWGPMCCAGSGARRRGGWARRRGGLWR